MNGVQLRYRSRKELVCRRKTFFTELSLCGVPLLRSGRKWLASTASVGRLCFIRPTTLLKTSSAGSLLPPGFIDYHRVDKKLLHCQRPMLNFVLQCYLFPVFPRKFQLDVHENFHLSQSFIGIGVIWLGLLLKRNRIAERFVPKVITFQIDLERTKITQTDPMSMPQHAAFSIVVTWTHPTTLYVGDTVYFGDYGQKSTSPIMAVRGELWELLGQRNLWHLDRAFIRVMQASFVWLQSTYPCIVNFGRCYIKGPECAAHRTLTGEMTTTVNEDRFNTATAILKVSVQYNLI